MRFVHVVIVCIMTTFSAGFRVVCGQQQQQQQQENDKRSAFAKRQPNLSDRVFTRNVVLERGGVTRTRCTGLCVKTDACTMFTWARVTSSSTGACRGYSGGGVTSCWTPQTLAGAEFYMLSRVTSVTTPEDWLDASCTSNKGCTPTNSRCFRGKCTCTQGYYYSVGSKTCVATCNAGDLQNTFLTYSDAGQWGQNTRSLTGPEFLCKAVCMCDPACLHYEFNSNADASPGHCNLNNNTALDAEPGTFDEVTSSGWTYNQRKCA